MSPSPTLSRRTAVGGLAAAATSVLTGCSVLDADRRAGSRSTSGTTPPPTRRPGTDPDVALAATVLQRERAMLERIHATVRRHPTLKAPLAGARSAHRAHIRLLAGAVPDQAPSPSTSPSTSPSASGSRTGTTQQPDPGHAVPGKAGPALGALARAEDRLSLVGRRSAFAARSGAFARVLASMAAAAAQQSSGLADAARGRP